jgi:hypothetical protein
MTAITTYSIQAEKESAAIINNLLQEANQDFIVLESASLTEAEYRPDSLRKQIDNALLDLSILNGSLETISGFMLDASVKCDSSGVGCIIEQYTKQISDCVGQIEEFLSASRRGSDVQ